MKKEKKERELDKIGDEGVKTERNMKKREKGKRIR